MKRAVMLSLVLITLLAAPSAAQNQTPAAPAQPSAPAADQPSVRVGTTIFTDYSYAVSPKSTADGVPYHANAFNLTRGYVNVTGTLNRYVAFRITPDVARESNAASTLSGSLEFRMKYGYGQFNLDRWIGSGSWVRLGIQQTPWLDFAEGIYRYRFQGTMFAEREGYFASADAGASFHYSDQSGYAEVHAGVYNGENYNKAEANDQKAIMVRGTVRPFAKQSGALKGLRLTAFYDHDRYAKAAERTRLIGAATFEHRFTNAAVEYLATGDRQRASTGLVEGRGYSLWITPKLSHGFEGLLRVDHLKPDDAQATVRQRVIAGAAYWLPLKGGATTALMFDYDGLTVSNSTAKPPADRKLIVHALIAY